MRLNPAVNSTGSPAASDDVLRIAWNDQTAPWPDLDGAGPLAFAPAAAATTTLSGRFTMQWKFGADASGYGALGALETSQGQAIAIAGTPFDVAAFDPACPSGPAVAATARRDGLGGDVAGVSIESAGSRSASRTS